MTRAPTVLLVSSGQDSPAAVGASLRSLEARILEAQSCFEVRRLLGEHAEIDLVITDVSLDDGNWFEVLTLLAHRTDETSLLVLSRGVDERFRQMVCSRGADGLLWGGDQATQTCTLIEEACRAATVTPVASPH